jgi:hypothetical protein
MIWQGQASGKMGYGVNYQRSFVSNDAKKNQNQFPLTMNMKQSPFTIAWTAALGLAFLTASHAETVLFEDGFLVEDQAALYEDGGRQEINREAAQRQTGSLAPTEYSSNGQPWQQQLSEGAVSPDGALRLYPTRGGNLLLSPAWSLEEKAGNYALGMRIRPVGGEELPEQIFIALGGSAGPLLESASGPLAGALLLRVLNYPEPTVMLMQDWGEISDSASFPGLTWGGELVLRWSQDSGHRISKVEVLFDGTSILTHEHDVFVGGDNVLFGARMGGGQQTGNGFGTVLIESLRYTRE